MRSIVRSTSFVITGIFLASFVFALVNNNLGVSASNSVSTGNHCPDHKQTGWALDKVNSKTGDETVDGVRFKWGGDPGVLKVKNKNAYKVTVTWCAKGGTDFYNGNKNTGEVVTTISPDQKVTVNFSQEVSYFMVYEIEKHETTSKYLFQFAKEWDGDEISLEGVEVEFTADGGFSWVLGVNDPVEVVPGETTLTNVKEVITGLPENCDYISDLPSEITAPKEGYDEDNLFTLTVTNTVSCTEDEDNGVVLADTDEPQQVTVTPVGAPDAGGAGTTALVGLVSSTAAVSLGAVIRKFSL